MAVPVVENTTTQAQTSGTSNSVAHTGTGSDLLAVVCISHRYGADGVSSVTYAGNAMTRAIGSFTNSAAYIYYRVSVASGSQTVTANFVAGASGRSNVISVHTITGADLSNTINATASNTGAAQTSSSISLTTTVTDCLLIDAMNAGQVASTPTITGSQTLLYSGNQATDTDGAANSWGHSREDQASIGSNSMSWSWAGGANLDHVGVAIRSTGSVGASSAHFLSLMGSGS